MRVIRYFLENRDRCYTWLGHWNPHAWLVFALLAVISDVFSQPLPVYGGLAAGAVWLATFVGEIGAHTGRLCERCISAAPVLDPQGAVRRWRLVLHLFHQAPPAWVCGAAVLGEIGLTLAQGAAHMAHRLFWARAWDVLMVMLVSYAAVLIWRHERLRPWCPYCRWGEEGSAEAVPPVPAGPGHR